MNISDLKEKKKHGTDEFPVALYHSNCFIPYQWHNEEELIYMLDGCADYKINDQTISLRKGDCIFCRSREFHSMIFERGQSVKFYALLFDSSYIFMQNDICHKFFAKNIAVNHLFRPEIEKENEIICIVRQICSVMRRQEYTYELEVKFLLTKLYFLVLKNKLYTMSAGDNIDDNLRSNMMNIMEYIHANFSEKLSVDDLASITGYSTPYFERFFKLYTGKTPVEYIILYRMQKAQQLLRETPMSILDISAKCGFSNVSYFIRTFKRFYSLPPHQYRIKMTP